MPDIVPEPSLYSEVLADCASATRHDGWTRDVKVTFCEVLAITGRVIEALDAVNRSGNTAYAQRRRDPLFAQAWQLALGEARHRLADALLTRALDGTRIVQLDPDGEVVAERHVYDNRLAFAVLRRLDRQAEIAAARAGVGSALSATLAAPADTPKGEEATALLTFENALTLLGAAPDLAHECETHEAHSLADRCWVTGDVRPPLRDLAPVGVAGARRELTLSHMH